MKIEEIIAGLNSIHSNGVVRSNEYYVVEEAMKILSDLKELEDLGSSLWENGSFKDDLKACIEELKGEKER